MSAVLGVSCCFGCSLLADAVDSEPQDDRGVEDGMKEEGRGFGARRDEGRMEEEEGEVCVIGFLLFRSRRRDLTLIGWTRLLLLRRRATLPTGPVPVLLKVRSGLGTQSRDSTFKTAEPEYY